MSKRDVLKRHAALVDRMATSLGIDLQEKAIGLHLTMDDLSEAVLRCTQCSNPDHCEGRLNAQPTASAPPSYCRNADLMMALRP